MHKTCLVVGFLFNMVLGSDIAPFSSSCVASEKYTHYTALIPFKVKWMENYAFSLHKPHLRDVIFI